MPPSGNTPTRYPPGPADADQACGLTVDPLEADGQPLYLPEFTANPQAVYQRLHEYGPVAPVELVPGVQAWLVVDYTAALEVLRAPETFSKDPRRWRAFNAGEVPLDCPVLPLMRWLPHAMYNDGKEHHRLRQVITDALAKVTPGVLRGFVKHHADRLVDNFAALGEADLVRQYTRVLPVLVLSDICGAPRDLGQRLLDPLLRTVDGLAARAASAEAAGCMAELVELRRKHPGVDATSSILAHPAGLDHEEITATLLLLMGFSSSVLQALMTSGLRLLLSDERFAGASADGSPPVEDALDEVLWHEPPVGNYAPHYPVRDVDFHGVRLREGDPVLISFAAANNDSSVVVGRTGNRAHLAWSAGPHACPAQSQARLIATVAIEKLIDRLPDMELAVPGDRLEWNPGPIYRTPTALPVCFAPASLTGPEAPSARRPDPAARQTVCPATRVP